MNDPDKLKTHGGLWLALGGAVGLLSLLLLSLSASGQAISQPQTSSLQVAQEAPETVFSGGIITYVLWITNTSGSTVNDIELYDTWTTGMEQAPPNRDTWWDRGILLLFNGYTADPPSAIASFTHTLNVPARRGEATWELNPLAAGAGVRIVFTATVPITAQPTLKNYSLEENWGTTGPTSLDNSVVAYVPGEDNATTPVASTLIVAPLLSLELSDVAETAPAQYCRAGRLITYTLDIHNMAGDERADSWRAEHLVVTETLPADVRDALISTTSTISGAVATYDSTTGILRWTFPGDYVLYPGGDATLIFVVRVPAHIAYNPKVYLQISNREVYAKAQGMPHRSANAQATVKLRLLSPFDKEVHTHAPPTADYRTYPHRFITYTLTFYNPTADDLSSLRITDDLFPTFVFSEVVTGTQPTQVSGTRIRWDNLALSPYGALSMTYVVSVPGSIIPNKCAGSTKYANAITATAGVAGFGTYLGHDDNTMAVVIVDPELLLSEKAAPTLQIPGELVTYTITLANVSDRDLPGPIILSDTLPYEPLLNTYFAYDSMVTPTIEPFTTTEPNVIYWELPGIPAGQSRQVIFRAVVDGIANTTYKNYIVAYESSTSICPLNSASVRVDTPFRINKFVSPDRITQGDLVTYSVELLNISPRTTYSVTEFSDDLSSVHFTDPADGDELYYHLISPTVLLPPGAKWSHAFQAIVNGTPEETGLGTPWCEDRGKAKKLSQQSGTVSFHIFSPEIVGSNLPKLAPVLITPSVSLLQAAYPNPVSVLGTQILTLTLRDNRINPTGPITGIVLKWLIPANATYGNYAVLSTTPVTSSQDAESLYWNDLTIPAGGETTILLTLSVPFVDNSTQSANYTSQALVTEEADPQYCIPSSKYTLQVNRGIELRKRPHPTAVGPYGEVEYTLDVRNLTGAPVSGIIVTDTLPQDWTYLGSTTTPPPVHTNPLVWQPDEIPPKSTASLVFKARAYTNLGTWINQVTATAPIHWGLYKTYTDEVGVYVKSGIGLFKDVTPLTVDAGGLVTYTITLFDGTTDTDMKDCFITDTLPAGFAFVKTVVGPTEFLDPDNPQVIKWSYPDIVQSGEAIHIVFQARADADLPTGDYYNQLAASANDANGDPITTIPQLEPTAPVHVQGPPTVIVHKRVDRNAIYAGQSVVYTITLYNETSDTYALVVTDTLPYSFTFAAAIAPTPTPQVIAGARQQVLWSGLSIAPHLTQTLSFRVNTDAQAHGTYCNAVQERMNSFVQPPLVNLACVNVSQVPLVDAQIAKSDGEQTAEAGQTLTYTIRYTNAATSELTLHNVVISDTLTPLDKLTVLNADAWTQVGSHFVITVGDLPIGAGGTLSMVVRVPDPLPDDLLVIKNSAGIDYTLSSAGVEVQTDNNHATDVDIVQALGKQATPQYINAGDLVTYTVTLYNGTQNSWASPVVTDTLSLGFTFEKMVSGAAPTVSTYGGRTRLTWKPTAALAPDSSQVWIFQARSVGGLPSGSYPDWLTAQVDENGATLLLPPSGPAAPVTVNGSPAIHVHKTASPATVPANQLVTYTLVISTEANSATTLHLTDTLPLSLTFDAALGSTPTPQLLNGERQKLLWRDQDIAPGETLTYTFRAHVARLAAAQQACNDVQTQLGDNFPRQDLGLACVQIQPLPRFDVQIAKDDHVLQAAAGDTLTYTIRYTNTTLSGGVLLQDVVLTETITPLTYVIVPAGSGWTRVGDSYVGHAAALAAGQSGVVTFTVRLANTIPEDVLNVENHVAIGYTPAADAYEPDLSNNQATDIDALNGPDLIITGMRFEPTSPISGVRYHIYVTVKNQGNVDITKRWDGSSGSWLFVTSVYIKPQITATAPLSPFDHQGETCYAWPGALAAGASQEYPCLGDITAPVAGAYIPYAQADVTWGGGAPWGQPFGMIQETNEHNNIYTGPHLTVISGWKVYLPLMLKNQ